MLADFYYVICLHSVLQVEQVLFRSHSPTYVLDFYLGEVVQYVLVCAIVEIKNLNII